MTAKPFGVALVALALAGLLAGFLAGPATAQSSAPFEELDATPDAPPDAPLVTPVRTDDPRETFASFRRLSDEMEAAILAYLDAPSFAGVAQLALLSDQMNALIDLEAEPFSSRRETGIRTMTFLMDIFGRLPPVSLADIPDAAQLEESGDIAIRIPGTPLYIARIEEGERKGEFLFVGATVDIAPRFFRSIEKFPLRSDLPARSFSSLGPQLTGPLIPRSFVAAMPPGLRTLWLDTPAWKVLVTLAAALILLLGVILLRRAFGSVQTASRIIRLLLKVIVPLLLLLVANFALPAFTFQINLSGRFADLLAIFKITLTYLSYAWLYWLAVRMCFEAVILSPRIPDTSLDANLLRLVSNILGIIGVVIIVAFGGQAIGLPILSVLAGLGIGGLAVALALRPTLENLIGGVILYIDRPVRVGDFCAFGDQIGTVEAIGVRTTKLRALDRTMIAVPNAQLADMQITNYAYCDRMLLHDQIGVRYETTPDQLRFLLAKMREMLHAHPRIERDSVRVRFTGYGDSALKIDLRVYVETREWNDFFAVREDVFLRLYDIVEEAGTTFGFPSQTLYLGRDTPPDPARVQDVEAEVQAWRQGRKLPFPRFATEHVDRLQGTLDYPPRGSVLSEGPDPAAETLSAEEEPLSTEEPVGEEPRRE